MQRTVLTCLSRSTEANNTKGAERGSLWEGGENGAAGVGMRAGQPGARQGSMATDKGIRRDKGTLLGNSNLSL